MSRWIDADELGASVIKNTVFDKGDVIKLIEDAPSIEIVRCRECRYWHSGECWGIPYRGDYDTSIDTKADDFCSYGCNSSEKPNNSEIPTGSERSSEWE